MSQRFTSRDAVMQRALELARRGLGRVEPNPAVGAVIVDDRLQLLGEGFHEHYGGPHGEVGALAMAGERARGATLYVTLEPCAHQGKTPPCAPQVIAAGVRKVVAAMEDPAPHVSGAGFRQLRDAGIEVEVGLLSEEARRLTRPFVKLQTTGLPYVHAKWAMTADGRIATRTGDSRWISSSESRAIVHALRGRMDAIVVGIGTALRDDPLLTARPAGPRQAVRIVVDTAARLPLSSQLVRSLADGAGGVLVAAGQGGETNRVRELREAGVAVLELPRTSDVIPHRDAARAPGTGEGSVRLDALLEELGRRRMTNVLVEGGGGLLGGFFDARLIDECHVFMGCRLLGGAAAPGPIGGWGLPRIAEAARLVDVETSLPGGDIYINGCVQWAEASDGEGSANSTAS